MPRHTFEGQVFNFWTVGRTLDYPFSLCTCRCGVVKPVNIYNVVRGASKSCGCHKRSETKARNTRHGLSKTLAYKRWEGMWSRCTNPNHHSFPSYKGRVPPEEWRDFARFYADMGECPPGYTLERKDNTKPYGPDNCVWVPFRDQALNTHRTTLVILEGERDKRSLKNCCEYLGLKYSTVIARIQRGIPIDVAVGHPLTVVKHKEIYYEL